MVEKIIVSRHEVLHYPWLDHTWVYVYYIQDAVTKTPQFQKLLKAFLRYGIRETTGKEFDAITAESDYLFIQYDTNEIVDILRNACDWLMKNARIKDPSSPKGQYILKHKDLLDTFLIEMKKILEEKTYKYDFQSVDGMN